VVSVAFLFFVVSACTLQATRESPLADPAAPGTTSVIVDDFTIVLSRQVPRLRDNWLGLRFFPDTAVVVLRRSPTLRLLLTAHKWSYLVEGPDLLRLSRAREVLAPGQSGSFDNGYAGISGVARVGDRFYAIYSAEDHEGMPVIPGTIIPGYYGSIGLAESRDEGRTWSKLGQVITSARPKHSVRSAGKAVGGVGEPGLIADASGRYLYLYYTDHSYGVRICMARADLVDGPPLLGRWKKYFEGAFEQPGLGGKETAIISAGSGALFPHPVYSAALNRYLMVFNVLAPDGIHVAHSLDGIHWTNATALIRDKTIPRVGRSVSWNGTIIWDDETGREGWLVYGYSERWGTDQTGGIPHYLVGRRVRVESR
jgi:hypothetical protein